MRISSHTNARMLFALNLILCAPHPVIAATISVSPAGDLQAALNAANPGDTILLPAGATYVGSFNLPFKGSSDSWITIQTSAAGSLPPAGTRVGPADAINMPKLVTPNNLAVLTTDDGANHYRFVGLEITSTPGIYVFDMVRVGTASTSLSAVPHDFDFDRVYIHGDPIVGSKRGIAMNGASMSVHDSYFSDFKSNWQDSQALCAWNGPGPFTIHNNYLEASGENVMFGGAPPTITGLIASNIDIRGNYFFKPLSWKVGDPSYAGTAWIVKNLLEFKNGTNITVDGNVFENSWIMAQIGFAVVLTPRTDLGLSPWELIANVAFTHNIVKHTTSGFAVGGFDSDTGQGSLNNLLVQDNLFEDIPERLFQLVGGPDSVTINHNTAFEGYTITLFDTLPPAQNFVYTNNISLYGTYGFVGSGYIGESSFGYYATGAVVNHNVVIGAPANLISYYYPTLGSLNYWPPTVADVGFGNFAAGDYSLTNKSPYWKAGTDHRNIGADTGAINSATAYAISGVPPRTKSPLR